MEIKEQKNTVTYQLLNHTELNTDVIGIITDYTDYFKQLKYDIEHDEKFSIKDENVHEFIKNVTEKLVCNIIDNNLIEDFMALTNNEVDLIIMAIRNDTPAEFYDIFTCCYSYHRRTVRAKRILNKYCRESLIASGTQRRNFDIINHWKYLKFWYADGLLSILDIKREYIMDEKTFAIIEKYDQYTSIVLTNIKEHIEIIKIGVYNILKYKKKLLGKIDINILS